MWVNRLRWENDHLLKGHRNVQQLLLSMFIAEEEVVMASTLLLNNSLPTYVLSPVQYECNQPM